MSDETRIARVYAEALFEAATEEGQLEAVRRDLDEWATGLRDSADLALFFYDEALPGEEKLPALKRLTEGAHPLFWNFLRLLVDKSRETVLEEIDALFSELVERSQGIVKVELTTAVPLPDSVRADLQLKLEASLGKRVDLTSDVDEALLGGARLRVGDRIADASIRQDLERLRSRLTSPPVRLEESVETAS